MSIPEEWQRFKPSGYDFLLVVIVLLVGAGSFGLGRLASIESTKPHLQFGEVNLSPIPAGGYAHFVDNRADAKTDAAEQGNSADPHTAGAVVASKSGEVYHRPDCPGAARIKDDNRIYFASAAAAQAAGYRPAKNCPGLE